MAAADATPLLEISNLGVSYYTRAGVVPAVVDFSLRIDAGERVGLVGESGCGKSTVAMAIMRYLGRNGAVVGGAVRFKGRDLNAVNERELRGLRGAQIAMIYQEPMAALNPSLTIGSQLMEVPRVHAHAGKAEARERALQVLADVRLADPERVLAAYAHQLSGGQQQRVVIAMALLSGPALLVLDEPTTALDVTVEAGIVDLIGDIGRRYGTAQLYISHNLGLIRETCERVYVMYAGEVVEEGGVETVFTRPRHPYTLGLLRCIPLPGSDKRARPLVSIPGQPPLPHERPRGCSFGPRCAHFESGHCDTAPIAIEAAGNPRAGHGVRCVRWRSLAREAPIIATPQAPVDPFEEELLQVDRVRKYYPVYERARLMGKAVGYVKANESIDFSARQRETVAIVGESGCGKSTFARVLMGLDTVSGGNIRLHGEDIGRTPVRRRAPALLRALQMVFQNPDETLNPSLSIGAQIARVIRKLDGGAHTLEVRAGMLRLLDLVKLPREFAARRPHQLSGGQKQRVAVARAFAGRPELVVADEPLSALDVSVQAAITELLMDIQREHGTTLLFISHDLGVVRYLADSVVVMYLGQVMERGSARAVFDPPYHPYTEALLAAVPIADPTVSKRRIVLEGTPPSALDPLPGCPFHTRCPRKLGSICERERPPAREAASGHVIACHIPLAELAAVAPVIRSAPG